MLVSSPGGQLRSHIFCPRVSVIIRGVEFSANLMVLDTQGIDVILGMETLARWGVLSHVTRLMKAYNGSGFSFS
jgi:Lon protease-like protein